MVLVILPVASFAGISIEIFTGVIPAAGIDRQTFLPFGQNEKEQLIIFKKSFSSPDLFDDLDAEKIYKYSSVKELSITAGHFEGFRENLKSIRNIMYEDSDNDDIDQNIETQNDSEWLKSLREELQKVIDEENEFIEEVKCFQREGKEFSSLLNFSISDLGVIGPDHTWWLYIDFLLNAEYALEHSDEEFLNYYLFFIKELKPAVLDDSNAVIFIR